VTSESPAIDTLRQLLERQLARIERVEPGVRDGEDPRDLHRFRVACRRSRALIRASRKLVGDQLAGVDAELRWLGSVSGAARDLDVLIEHLREVVDGLAPDTSGGEAILAALEEERGWARETLVEALASDRYRRLLLTFGATLPTLHAIDDDIRPREIARREFKRLRAAYDELGPEPPDDQLHRLRIKAKRARYAAELAERDEDGAFAAFVAAATELQDLIGSHQDAVVAEKRVRALATRESQLAAGRIVEHERRRRAEARANVPAVWKRVERAARKAF